MIRLRNTDEWVGLLVLLAIAAFVGGVLQAGLLRDWFRPVSTLRILLPEAGTGGLAVGAGVEVLGTHAGVIKRIVIDPRQRMYAEAEIDDQARAFIRRDSAAVIRREFGVAGAGYIDVLRGHGAEMDWKYAVIEANTERAPGDTVSSLIDDVRQKIFPILDDAGRAMHALADTAEQIDHGEGNVGKLLHDDTLEKQAEATVAQLQQLLSGLSGIITQANATVTDVHGLIRGGDGKDSVQALLRRTDQTLASLQTASRSLAQAAQHAPAIAGNVEGSTANLPALLTQAQVSAQELEMLLTQLRGMWLLGGNGAAPPAPQQRLPASEVRP